MAVYNISDDQLRFLESYQKAQETKFSRKISQKEIMNRLIDLLKTNEPMYSYVEQLKHIEPDDNETVI